MIFAAVAARRLTSVKQGRMHRTGEGGRGAERKRGVEWSGGSCRIRTYDLRIKSPLLYQLS